MEQIYLFEDWTSASRMKNTIRPELRIDVGVVGQLPSSGEGELATAGYQITVYDSRNENVVYKFYVDHGREGTWSLTTDEAIQMLNQIGFPCKFTKDHYKIDHKTAGFLGRLRGLGYSHIYREPRPAEVFVLSTETPKWRPLSQVVPEYNYHDFWFLDNNPRKIDGILESMES